MLQKFTVDIQQVFVAAKNIIYVDGFLQAAKLLFDKQLYRFLLLERKTDVGVVEGDRHYEKRMSDFGMG